MQIEIGGNITDLESFEKVDRNQDAGITLYELETVESIDPSLLGRRQEIRVTFEDRDIVIDGEILLNEGAQPETFTYFLSAYDVVDVVDACFRPITWKSLHGSLVTFSPPLVVEDQQ